MQKYQALPPSSSVACFWHQQRWPRRTNLAYATGEPRAEYMVFLDKGNQVPDVAQVTAAQGGERSRRPARPSTSSAAATRPRS